MQEAMLASTSVAAVQSVRAAAQREGRSMPKVIKVAGGDAALRLGTAKPEPEKAEKAEIPEKPEKPKSDVAKVVKVAGGEVAVRLAQQVFHKPPQREDLSAAELLLSVSPMFKPQQPARDRSWSLQSLETLASAASSESQMRIERCEEGDEENDEDDDDDDDDITEAPDPRKRRLPASPSRSARFGADPSKRKVKHLASAAATNGRSLLHGRTLGKGGAGSCVCKCGTFACTLMPASSSSSSSSSSSYAAAAAAASSSSSSSSSATSSRATARVAGAHAKSSGYRKPQVAMYSHPRERVSGSGRVVRKLSSSTAAAVPTLLPARYHGTYGQKGRVGIYTQAERAALIAKFLRKRQRRVWFKKVRYDCRKNLAQQRVRVKGRFVKRTDTPSPPSSPALAPALAPALTPALAPALAAVPTV